MSQQTEVALSALNVGDVIYDDVTIKPEDMADPNSKSTTAKKIRKGDKISRLCVVLTAGQQAVEVAYLATFKGSSQLPATFADKDLWYPVAPAAKEGTREPLPKLDNDDQATWVCLREKQIIDKPQVKRINNLKFSERDAGLIKAAMRA